MASYKSFIKCVICFNKRTNTPNLFMASLPLDPTRCREWLRAIGQDELVELPIEKLHQLKYVSSKHFRRADFNKQGNRLLESAVPNLDLPLPPLQDEVFMNFPLYIGSLSTSRGFYVSHVASPHLASESDSLESGTVPDNLKSGAAPYSWKRRSLF